MKKLNELNDGIKIFGFIITIFVILPAAFVGMLHLFSKLPREEPWPPKPEVECVNVGPAFPGGYSMEFCDNGLVGCYVLGLEPINCELTGGTWDVDKNGKHFLKKGAFSE